MASQLSKCLIHFVFCQCRERDGITGVLACHVNYKGASDIHAQVASPVQVGRDAGRRPHVTTPTSSRSSITHFPSKTPFVPTFTLISLHFMLLRNQNLEVLGGKKKKRSWAHE